MRVFFIIHWWFCVKTKGYAVCMVGDEGVELYVMAF